MEKPISLQDHKLKKAALRGFREWKRLLPSLSFLDETTRIKDFPDELLLFFCEDTPKSRVLVYDLLMGIYGMGSGYEFESLPPDAVSALLDPFFLITDLMRFECLRRLGWAYPHPGSVVPIVELVGQIRDRISRDFLGMPELTPEHPAFKMLKNPGLLEEAVFLRRHIPEAVRRFRETISAPMEQP